MELVTPLSDGQWHVEYRTRCGRLDGSLSLRAPESQVIAVGRGRGIGFLLAAGLLLLPQEAQSQGGVAVHVVLGLVTDSAGAPLLGADVALPDLALRARTDLDGRFRIGNVPPGSHKVVARRLGYAPEWSSIRVADSGASVVFRLRKSPQVLPTVSTTSRRGGLSGFVTDVDAQPVVAALVDAVDHNERASTDSAGRFFLPLRAGKHVLRISRDSFATRLVSVSIPPDSGRMVLVSLLRGSPGGAAIQATALFELGRRLNRRSAGWSAIVTRDDIAASSMRSARELASAAAARQISELCPVIVNGGPRRMMQWEIDAVDVELIEVYVEKPRRLATGTLRRRGPSACSGVIVYVWLLK